MSDEAPLGDGNFRSTVIGGAPRVWQRILVSRYADAKGRLSLSQTCSAARSLVLQHSRRFKARLALDSVEKDSEALHRRLRSVKQALRIRGQQGSLLFMQHMLNYDADALITAITTLAEVGQHVHTLLLPCNQLAPEVLAAAAHAFPNLLRLSLSSQTIALQHGVLDEMLRNSRSWEALGSVSLPPPSAWPSLLQLVIYEDLHTAKGKPKVTGLKPYLQQLDSLSLHDRQPHEPSKTVLTSPATLLRHLRVSYLTDDWVKVLLRHAPVLERVTAEFFALQQSHAASQCNWQQITFNSHQDATDYIKLPRRRAGKLTVGLDEEAVLQMIQPEVPSGVLDISIHHAPTHPTMLLQRVKQDLQFSGVKVVRLQPTRELQQRSASQQATAIQRYLPVLAALWHPSYQLQVWAWALAPEVLRMLMRAVARVQAQYVSFTGCDFTKFRARTLNLPADFPALPTTHFTVNALTDDWVSLLQRHMPAVQRVECNDVLLIRSIETSCSWTQLTVHNLLPVVMLAFLPRPSDGSRLTVRCSKGIQSSAVQQMQELMGDYLASRLADTPLVNDGICEISSRIHVRGAGRPLSAAEQAAALSLSLQLAAQLPFPPGGVGVCGWLLAPEVIAELQQLPRWPAIQVERDTEADLEDDPQPGTPPPQSEAATDKDDDLLMMTNFLQDAPEARQFKTLFSMDSDVVLPPLPSGQPHHTLMLENVIWPQDPALFSQLLQSVPNCYTVWRVSANSVSEETVRAICDAAITHRSVEYPLVVDVVFRTGDKDYAQSVLQHIKQQGGEGYVSVTAHHVLCVDDKIMSKIEESRAAPDGDADAASSSGGSAGRVPRSRRS